MGDLSIPFPSHQETRQTSPSSFVMRFLLLFAPLLLEVGSAFIYYKNIFRPQANFTNQWLQLGKEKVFSVRSMWLIKRNVIWLATVQEEIRDAFINHNSTSNKINIYQKTCVFSETDCARFSEIVRPLRCTIYYYTTSWGSILGDFTVNICMLPIVSDISL